MSFGESSKGNPTDETFLEAQMEISDNNFANGMTLGTGATGVDPALVDPALARQDAGGARRSRGRRAGDRRKRRDRRDATGPLIELTRRSASRKSCDPSLRGVGLEPSSSTSDRSRASVRWRRDSTSGSRSALARSMR
jgi:hypothetical protein